MMMHPSLEMIFGLSVLVCLAGWAVAHVTRLIN